MAGYYDSSAVTDILRRDEWMEADRQPWIQHWEEISELIDPRYVNTFRSANLYNKTLGQDNTDRQFDITPPLALQRFASAMDWMLTPINSKYQRIRPLEETLSKNPKVMQYCDAVRDQVFRYRYSPRANFASQIGEHWMGLGSFGTSSTFIDRLDGGGTRYKNIHLGEMKFAENHQGIVDTAHRRFLLTARQAAQKWLDKTPSKILEDAKKPETCDKKYTFVHCVYPNSDLDPGRRDYKGMAFSSDYVCVELQEFCQRGGYATFPYAISRYVTAPGETYGRSPAMMALPNIKSLNQMKRTILKMGERAVDPVLLAHDDGVVGSISLRSGFVNYGAITADGKKLVHPLDTASNMPIGKDIMDDERAGIKDMFLVTIFQMLEENPQMTATEVMERVKAKNALIAPMMGRQQSECMNPLTERELDILARDGLLPSMPPELKEAGGQIHLLYDSEMSRAMRADEASGFMRTLETAINYSQATQDPSALDWLEIDTAMPEIADIQGTPARWVSTPDQVQQKRTGRQQAQAQQHLADAAPAIASILKTTGSAVPGTGTGI